MINTMAKMTTIREWMIDHLEIESTVLHKESEEGKAQMQREGANKMGEHHDHEHHDRIMSIMTMTNMTTRIMVTIMEMVKTRMFLVIKMVIIEFS